MKKIILGILIAVVLTALAHASLKPVDLRCDYAVNPLGVDSSSPRLFWKLESSLPEQHQSAYQILAATSVRNLTSGSSDLWDSGKVESDDLRVPFQCPRRQHAGATTDVQYPLAVLN